MRYANVTATLALFISLGGGAYAATELARDSVGARELKRNAVRSTEVRDGTLRARDFARGVLRAGPRGATGATGAAGPAGASGPAGPKGDRGPSDLYHDIESDALVVYTDSTTTNHDYATLDPGRYAVTSNVVVEGEHDGVRVSCTGAGDAAEATVDDGDVVTLTLAGPVEVKGQAREGVTCTSTGGSGANRATFRNIDVTAVKVETFHPEKLSSYNAPGG